MFDKNSVLPKKVTETRNELMTWDWIYGQTPEFTNSAETDFEWGHVVRSYKDNLDHFGLLNIDCMQKAHFLVRHGKIKSASITTDSQSMYGPTISAAISVALEGKSCHYATYIFIPYVRLGLF